MKAGLRSLDTHDPLVRLCVGDQATKRKDLTMKQKGLYFILAVIGFVGPYYFLISFLTAHGVDGKAFVQQLFGTKISTFFAVDLMVSSVVFLRYLGQEATRYSIEYRWVYVVALLTVGLSFALPLFLYVRESHLEAKAGVAGGSF
jgi:hypothetical protein